jgi:hypothetical protein
MRWKPCKSPQISCADQRGLSLDALVDLLDKPSKHDALIVGSLSIAEAEKLAQKTHVPFSYFFKAYRRPG